MNIITRSNISIVAQFDILVRVYKKFTTEPIILLSDRNILGTTVKNIGNTAVSDSIRALHGPGGPRVRPGSGLNSDKIKRSGLGLKRAGTENFRQKTDRAGHKKQRARPG